MQQVQKKVIKFKFYTGMSLSLQWSSPRQFSQIPYAAYV